MQTNHFYTNNERLVQSFYLTQSVNELNSEDNEQAKIFE